MDNDDILLGDDDEEIVPDAPKQAVATAQAILAQAPTQALANKIKAKFDKHFGRQQGGANLTYVKPFQVQDRLDEVFGIGGWWFTTGQVREGGNSISVEGTLTVIFPGGRQVSYSNFGANQINGGMNFGEAVKGAASDCLKRCAALIGIGRYLSDADEDIQNVQGAQQNGQGNFRPQGNFQPQQGYGQMAPQQNFQPQQNFVPQGGSPLLCDTCGDQLTSTTFRDGSVWPPEKLAQYGNSKHGATLCMNHYRQANAAAKAAGR